MDSQPFRRLADPTPDHDGNQHHERGQKIEINQPSEQAELRKNRLRNLTATSFIFPRPLGASFGLGNHFFQPV